MAKKHLFEKSKSDPKAEPDALEVAPVVLPEGHVWIDRMDGNGGVLERVSLPQHQHGFRITLNGENFEHVSDHADGTWQFEKK